MMGEERAGLALVSNPPTVVMMVGIQGAGKTTTCGKLARLFKGQGKRVLLVAADPRRPAAGDQLASLGRDLQIDVHRSDQVHTSQADVVRICQAGLERGRDQGYDLVVLDTGGGSRAHAARLGGVGGEQGQVLPTACTFLSRSR